jgi:hypothetical protein
VEQRPEPYEDAWKDLHARRTAGVWVLAALVPVYLLYLLERSVQSSITHLLWYVWLAALSIVGVRIQLFRCPRCQYTFTWRALWNPFTSKCLHCGLRIDESAGPSPVPGGKP